MLLVDKPPGITSHDVVAVVRRAARIRRVGHAGTLDPFATGLLVLLLGRGTRLVGYIDGEPKTYLATIQFGSETDTDDPTGAVIGTAAAPDPDAARQAISRLTGPIDQVPPAYSAKKVAGERAYAAARRGAVPALAPARVTVHRWEILAQRDDALDVRVVCSGGTYVRALARDLGRLCDSAAHLASLRRVGSGPFAVADAVPLERVAAGDLPIRPLRAAIPSLPTLVLQPDSLARVLHGNAVPAMVEGARVALVDPTGELVAIGERAGDVLQPKVVLRDA